MVKAVDQTKVPWWVSNVIVPLVNLTLAFIVSGLFIFIHYLLIYLTLSYP